MLVCWYAGMCVCALFCRPSNCRHRRKTTCECVCVLVYMCVTQVCVCVCRRIKMQYDRLSQEMQDIAVAGLILKRPRMKASRSLPAIGLGAKHTPRPRVSLSLPLSLSLKRLCVCVCGVLMCGRESYPINWSVDSCLATRERKSHS